MDGYLRSPRGTVAGAALALALAGAARAVQPPGKPAAFCGIVGLKPTYGRVSMRGVFPLSPSLDHVGPLCRTVVDTALMLEVIADCERLDLTSVSKPRIGIARRPFFDDLDPEIETAMDEALIEIDKLSLSIRDVDLPPVPADPNQIEQVVVNLLLNAADAVGGEGGGIRLATTRALAPPRGSPPTRRCGGADRATVRPAATARAPARSSASSIAFSAISGRRAPTTVAPALGWGVVGPASGRHRGSPRRSARCSKPPTRSSGRSRRPGTIAASS